MVRNQLHEIEEAWEEVKSSPELELSPKAIDYLISTVKRLQDELDQYKAYESLKKAGFDIKSHKEVTHDKTIQ